jgi:uncharacterized protein (TIGR04562 family)
MLASEYQFPWGILRSIIAGASAIDLEGLAFGDRRHAEGFLAAYGYDPRTPTRRAELEVIRAKSLAFLREELLQDEPILSFPDDVAEAEVADLLVMVSQPQSTDDSQWACALLRVMHAYAHSRNDPFERHHDHLRRQILDRIERHLYRHEDDSLFLGRGQDAVPLVGYEAKAAKSPHRIVMKLLHKPGNLGESIHDRMGVRLVTRDLMDVMLVVRYLRVHNVVVFANVAPDRSRNTLLSVDDFQLALDQISGSDRAVSEEELRRVVNDTRQLESGGTNARSGRGYRAIHFTVRQLIDFPVGDGESMRIFFPYEVQVMDQDAFEDIAAGEAAHAAYAERQRKAVKRRVLRGLLPRSRRRRRRD